MLQAVQDGTLCGGLRRPGSRKSRSGEFLASEKISLIRSLQHGAGLATQTAVPGRRGTLGMLTDLLPMLRYYGPPGSAVDGRLRGIAKVYLMSHCP
jgi:hypothetical protein